MVNKKILFNLNKKIIPFNHNIDYDINTFVNPIENNNLTIYTPFDNNNYELHLINENNNITFFDYGYETDDLKYKLNRFTKSFIQCVFYEHKNINSRILYSINIPLQLNEYNFHDFILKPVFDSPIILKINNPNNKNNKGFTKLFYLFNNNTFIKNMYCQFIFKNAVNGENYLYKNINDENDYNDNYFFKITYNFLKKDYVWENMIDNKINLYE